jgi:DNA polymerase
VAILKLSECKRCPLHKHSYQPVKGRGSRTAKIFIIGEAPGRQEDRYNIPFYPKARAGRFLTALLGSINQSREDVFISNINKCRPKDNRTPFANEIEACLPWLKKELIVVRPGIVITLGGNALYALVGKKNVGQHRGKFLMLDNMIPPRKDSDEKSQGVYLVPMYHPASVCYGSKERRTKFTKALQDDFKMIENFLIHRVIPEVEVYDQKLF